MMWKYSSPVSRDPACGCLDFLWGLCYDLDVMRSGTRALLIFAAAAGSLHGSEGIMTYDSSAPGFWSRRYDISGEQETRFVMLRVHHVPRAMEELAFLLLKTGGRDANPPKAIVAQGTEAGYWPLKNQMVWELSREIIDETTRKVLRRGILRHYSTTARAQNAGPDPGELYFKRKRLLLELDWLRTRADRLPGLSALLSAQFKNMDYLINLLERSRSKVYLSITLIENDSEPTPFMTTRPSFTGGVGVTIRLAGDNPPSSSPPWLSSSTARFAPDYWSRAPIAGCGALPDPIEFELRVKDTARTSGSIQRILARTSHKLIDDPCGRRESGGATSYSWVPAARLKRLVTELMEEGELVRYHAPGGNDPWQAFSHARDRFDILRRELASETAMKSAVPFIHGLAESEISRLEPSAKTLDRWREHRLVRIKITAS